MNLLCALALLSATALQAAEKSAAGASSTLHAALPDAKWREVDNAVDRGLAWIATQQSPDGRFGGDATAYSAQPAVTSLCVMAFLSRGHLPGYGPYGENLNRAIDFVISCQMPDGLFSYLPPEPVHLIMRASGNATYNHAIAGLMLGEVYGHVNGQRMKNVRLALDRALAFTRDLQTRPKENPEDLGGWRYLRLFYMGRGDTTADSDMSVTAWQLMFLRSARNAEFNVPQIYIDDAMAYIHRSFDENEGYFYYVMSGPQVGQHSRGLVGAGIVALSLAGEHRSPMALSAGNWLLQHPFRYFDETVGGGAFFNANGGDRFYYSTYYCSQAAAQLGGHYWETIFPPITDILVSAQNSDGSWPISEGSSGRGGFGVRRNSDYWIGPAYSTAMAILSLTPGDQLLPVYQR